MKARGETNIALAMDMALAILDQRRYKNKVTSILFLSDGDERGALKRLESLLP
jgi:Mg-chelatase subunit ChlD